MSFKSRLLFLPLAFSLILPGIAGAQSVSKRYSYVSEVDVEDDNFLWIKVAGDFSLDHGCTNNGWARSAYPLTDERTKAWLAIVLESFRSQKNIVVTSNGCTTEESLILVRYELAQ